MCIFQNESFALVISDVQMPGLSGVELLRRITENFPDTAVIMLSGVDRPQRVLYSLRLGAVDYLIKPCDMEVFELSVDRALERRALQLTSRQYKKDIERRNLELSQRQADLERMQIQLVHNEKMASLGQLAAGLAHELNNPSGFIYGNMELLRDSTEKLQRVLRLYDAEPLSPALRERVNELKREVDYENLVSDLQSIIADCYSGATRIRDVAQNLRLFSRLDEAEFKKVDIHEGIDSTIRLLKQYYSPDRITLERDYSELPLVDCYAGQLNQVWMNLLINAAQATLPHGTVRVSTRREDQMVVISVADTGSGITAENLNKIFDPFFTTKPVGVGSGLGLSIAYGVIKHHGGSITVESQPGTGTIFEVVIPINAKDVKVPAASYVAG